MNIIDDILTLIGDDTEHRVKITIDSWSVTVYLDYDPEGEYREDYIIPITYEIADEFAFIPHDDFIKMYNIADYGMDKKEIKMIYDIMDYFESHHDEITELCRRFRLSMKDEW